MRSAITIILMNLLALGASAQKAKVVVVRGLVTDEHTGTKLAHASVVASGEGTAVVTNPVPSSLKHIINNMNKGTHFIGQPMYGQLLSTCELARRKSGEALEVFAEE